MKLSTLYTHRISERRGINKGCARKVRRQVRACVCIRKVVYKLCDGGFQIRQIPFNLLYFCNCVSTRNLKATRKVLYKHCDVNVYQNKRKGRKWKYRTASANIYLYVYGKNLQCLSA